MIESFVPDAMIFDVDGTLVDTNEAHVDAWQYALRRSGYDVPRERIAVEIGKGGDKVVPSLVGRHADARDGSAIRAAHGERFIAIARSTRFRVFPGARALLERLRELGISTAVATSSQREYLDADVASSGLDVESLVDIVVTGSDAERSKPSPDIVVAAVERLSAAPERSIMVGDTPFDGEACAGAGVAFIGVLCGGRAADELLGAGARAVYDDPADLLAHLAAALAAAAPAVR